MGEERGQNQREWKWKSWIEKREREEVESGKLNCATQFKTNGEENTDIYGEIKL